MVAGALGAFFAPGSQAWSPSGPRRLHFCLGSGRFGVALLLAPLLPPVVYYLGSLLVAFGCFWMRYAFIHPLLPVKVMLHGECADSIAC